MHQYDFPHPAVTIDVVAYTLLDDQLKLLLIRRANEPFRGKWALPGGFVSIEESLEEAAHRELEEETGVSGVHLEQLYTFGRPDRDPRERVISVAYFTLIPADKVQLRAASDAEDAGWFGTEELPELAFDHEEIVKTAYKQLLGKLEHSTSALQLLPEQFTLGELQNLYTTIMQLATDAQI